MRIFKRCLQALLILLALLIVAAALASWVMMEIADRTQIGDRVSTSPPGGMHVSALDSRIFVQQLGDKNAPPVVFVHGTGSWSETWRPSMQKAVKAGYRAIALDLPPFGFSVPPAGGDYSKVKQAQRLLAALDALGIRQAVFVAHSFGAAPVMEAIMADPQRARAVILVDAALGMDSPQTDGSDSAIQSVLRIQPVSRAISAALLTNPAFTDTLLRSFISEKDKATPEWIGLYQRPLALEGSYRHVARWLPELLSQRARARSDMPESYRALKIPVRMIWGETDTITPVSQALNLQRLIPDARVVRLPKAGHIPQIEEPEAFLDALGASLHGL